MTTGMKVDIARAAGIALAFVLLHPAAHAQSLPPSVPVEVHRDVPFADGFLMDIHVPDGDGTMYPTVVTLHGGTGRKSAMDPLASALAERGFLVFNAAWLAPDRPFDAPAALKSFGTAACAVRFAWANADAYGGDAGPLTVVGLSAGGLAGALVSLAGSSEFDAPCEAGVVTPEIGLFVGLEGAYDAAVAESGGLAAAARQEPGLPERLDPRTYVSPDTDLRVVLFLGDEFASAVPPAEAFLDSLRNAGVRAELRQASGPHLASTFTAGVLGLLFERAEEERGQ